jgi:D-amino-acid dehydrogenase
MLDRLRFAGTLEMGGLDLGINPRRVLAIRQALPQYLKGFENITPLEVWSGLRPCTPDGLPIIGRTPEYRNLTVATGHAMIGMRTGTGTGKLVAELLCAETPFMDLAPFRVERF